MTVLWPKGRFKPGFSWRVLAHKRTHEGRYLDDHQVDLSSEDFDTPIELDELVMDHWLHIEQMSGHWWMRFGNYRAEITIDRYGKPSVYFAEEETPEELAEYCERRRTGS